MKAKIATVITVISLFSATAFSQTSNEFKTKIVINAIASEDISKEAPLFILYPEGESLKILEESGAIPQLEKSLTKLGYSLVSRESDAAVYVRVDYKEAEPYSTSIEYENRPTLDYSNSASTTNYAAMLGGGRYQKLANPAKHREANNAEAILGPNGEIITLADQEDRATKIIRSDKQSLEATIYPIYFEVSAWTFDQDDTQSNPQQLWAVQASYNNLRDEETQPQLKDLSKSASRFFGKNLKKEKLVARK